MVNVPMGYEPGANIPKALTVGKYSLELRAHAPVLSGMPAFVTARKNRTSDANHPSYGEWRRSFPGPEICRSNRVELEILPRTGD
jgi:hypothetical protein